MTNSTPCACRTTCGEAAVARDTQPIACDVTVFTAAERVEHRDRARRLFTAVERLGEEPDGYAFTFAAAPDRELELARWIDNERRCCPFFRFEVASEADGRLRLRISGPEGAKQILRDGLAELTSKE